MGNEQLLKLFDYLLANGRYRGANYLPENQSIHYDYVNKPVDFRFSHEGEEFKPVDFRFSHEGEEFSRDVLQEEDYLLLLQPGSWPLSTDFKDQLDAHISAVSNIARNKSEADGLTFLRYYIKNLTETSKVGVNIKLYVAKKMLENLKNSEVNNGRMLSAGAGVIGAEVIDIFEAPIILLASQAKYLADASNFFPSYSSVYPCK